MVPMGLTAMQVKFAVSFTSFSSSTFLPMGMLSSGVKSIDSAFLHLTLGIGEPTATHVKLIEAPSMTSSTFGGGMVKEGATRRTIEKTQSEMLLLKQGACLLLT